MYTNQDDIEILDLCRAHHTMFPHMLTTVLDTVLQLMQLEDLWSPEGARCANSCDVVCGIRTSLRLPESSNWQWWRYNHFIFGWVGHSSNFSSASSGSHCAVFSGGAHLYILLQVCQWVSYITFVKAANSAAYGPTMVSTFIRTSTAYNCSHLSLGRVTSSSNLQYHFPPASDGGILLPSTVEWDRSSSFNSLLALPHRGEVGFRFSKYELYN